MNNDENVFEILAFQHENNSKNNYKAVKLLFCYNLIFSFDLFDNLNQIMIISQFYSKIIENPKIHSNIFSLLNNLEITNYKLTQIQILSTLHNFQIISDFFLTNLNDCKIIQNHLLNIQNLKKIEDFYNINEFSRKKIGSGHFGKVFLVSNLQSTNKFALKFVNKFYDNKINSEINSNENEPDLDNLHKIENFKCIQWEKDIFIFLSHTNLKNVIKCYEFFETPKNIYYINEYCNRGNLKQLNFHKSLSFINKLLKQFINGIFELHKYGIIHRDIKNTNTLLNKDDQNVFTIKIIDFGLSKIMGFKDFSDDSYGSLPFKSPQQILKHPYDFKVDVWALGISLFWLIYGDFPYTKENKLSGAGKSTIVNLLDKFYEPDCGTITLDGVDLREWDTRFLRENIGLVLQKNHIFDGSIEENIRYGKPDATFEEVVEAAKKASVYDQIAALPKGFETAANHLSGGQQQRIALARMFLKNPPIIFLDEPTASLDAIATEQIKSAIDAIKKDRTVIIISHSISQIIDSEMVYALQEGRLEQSGDPDELYRKGGVYKDIVDASARSLNIEKLAQTLAQGESVEG